MTDKELLERAIEEKGIKLKTICEKCGITYGTLSNKINSETEFTASEIMVISGLLGLSTEQKEAIFFSQKCE